jgi:hypothetical protein
VNTHSTARLRTVGVIAEELHCTVAEVQSLLAANPHIRPIARAGILRLFDAQAVSQIRHAKNARDARRLEGGRHA